MNTILVQQLISLRAVNWAQLNADELLQNFESGASSTSQATPPACPMR
jgi:hypothetical protein